MEAHKRLKNIRAYIVKTHAHEIVRHFLLETFNNEAYTKFLVTTLECGSRPTDGHARYLFLEEPFC